MDELFELPEDIAYTEDWFMASRSTKVAPAQGGFLVVKPSLRLFRELQAIVQEGDWRGGKGAWGGSGVGYFYGGPTIQGLVPYFFQVVHPGTALVVSRCVYDNMVDNPFFKDTRACRDRTPNGQCDVSVNGPTGPFFRTPRYPSQRK